MNSCFIRILPLEILSEIFVLSLPEDALIEEVDGCPEPCAITDAPLTLHTCHDWRALAIGLQPLWSSIFVDIAENGRIKPPTEVIQLWLKRSEPHALFIGLKVHPNAINVSDDIDRVVGLFTAHLRRWKCVHLYLPFRDLPKPLLQLQLNVETPLLTPLLTSIDTDIADIQSDVLRHSLPLLHAAECVHLFSYLEADLALGWLTACSNVRDFQIQSVRSCKYMLETVRHDRVRSLTLHNADDHLHDFFNNLILPALERVDITCALEDILFAPGLGYLVERSRCNLWHLVLDSTSLREDELITLLKSIPSLHHLEIIKNSYFCVQDRLLNLLAAGKLCTRLQLLSLGGSTLECTDGVLGNMVKARRPYTFPSGIDASSSRHLRSLELSFDEMWLQGRPKDKAALELAAIGGLRISLCGISLVVELEL